MTLQSARHGYDFTTRFPKIVAAVAALPVSHEP